MCFQWKSKGMAHTSRTPKVVVGHIVFVEAGEMSIATGCKSIFNSKSTVNGLLRPYPADVIATLPTISTGTVLNDPSAFVGCCPFSPKNDA